MRRVIFGRNEKMIIGLIGAGLLITASMVVPNLPLILKPFVKRHGPKGLKKTLRKLEEKGIIYLGGEKIKLTKKGEALQQQIMIKDLEIQKPDEWDKIWRLISYDIPDYRKKERDWFRYNLERLGFEKIQESLWVLPYECKEEIAVLSQSLKISPFVILMTTDILPGQDRWKRLFHLDQ
jgi:DNA-binding transcriptional regulator PaaX